MDYEKYSGIDLHIHTTSSDGTVSPSEILNLAKELNLGAIAITDHDTLKGVKKAQECGISESLGFLTGVEISSKPPSAFNISGSLHILGYGIRTNDPDLNHMLADLQKSRADRNPEIINRLNLLGFHITSGELAKKTGMGQPGRSHIARLMVEKGITKSVNEAFDLYLAAGKPAYVDKPRIECSKAIKIITKAGGIPVLAHPGLLRSNHNVNIEQLVADLKEKGLKGLEVYYPGHTEEETRTYREIAHRYDLLITGGSDFHGSLYPNIKMGSGQGSLFVPYVLYEKISAAIKENESGKA